MTTSGLTGTRNIPPYLLFKIRRGVIAINENLSRRFLTLQEALVKTEANILGLIYNGPQRSRTGIEFYLITDTENMSTFAVKPTEMLRNNLELHRRKFEEGGNGKRRLE